MTCIRLIIQKCSYDTYRSKSFYGSFCTNPSNIVVLPSNRLFPEPLGSCFDRFGISCSWYPIDLIQLENLYWRSQKNLHWRYASLSTKLTCFLFICCLENRDRRSPVTGNLEKTSPILTFKVWLRFAQNERAYVVDVTKRTGGTTNHQRQHHAQCWNGYQTHSIQNGAQPVVYFHLGRDHPRPFYWYQQYFTVLLSYFSEPFVCRFWLSPTYELVLSWPDVGCDPFHPDLYTSSVTLTHSHTPTYTIRTLCVCPVTTTPLQKLRHTKDPYEVFQCVSGTYREQQTHPRVFPRFLPTYPSTKSSVFCSSRSTPPPRKTWTQRGLTWNK